MSVPKLQYQKINFSKWLLAVALLLSVFSFTGPGDHFNSSTQQKVKIELVCSVNKKITQSTVFYKRAVISLHQTGEYNTALVLYHNRQMKIQLDLISKRYHYIAANINYVLQKTIPFSSIEDVFTSVTG